MMERMIIVNVIPRNDERLRKGKSRELERRCSRMAEVKKKKKERKKRKKGKERGKLERAMERSSPPLSPASRFTGNDCIPDDWTRLLLFETVCLGRRAERCQHGSNWPAPAVY